MKPTDWQSNRPFKPNSRTMNLRQILIVLNVSLASVAPVAGQEPSVTVATEQEELSLQGAVERALQNNYGIIISRGDLEVAGINNHWGNAGRYPTIGLDASNNTGYELYAGNLSNRTSAGVGLNWTLFDGFRVNITKSRLEDLEELASGRLAVVIESAIEDIVLGYYNVLLQQEFLEVLRTVMNLSDDRYRYELKRQELGGAVTYEVLQAQNVYLSDKASFMSQEVAVRNAVRNLNFMMGEEPGRRWDFTETFQADTTTYDLDELLARMISGNRSLMNQYTNLLLKEKETALRKSDYYPSVNLGAGMETGHTFSRTAGESSIINRTLSPYGVVRLSFDIYSAGTRRRAMEVARIGEEIARVETGQMEHALTNELFNLYDYYQVRIALLGVARENLDAASLNLTISEDKYRTGVINSFNYRDVQLIYLNAAVRRLDAIYGLIDSRTKLTRITGGFVQQF